MRKAHQPGPQEQPLDSPQKRFEEVQQPLELQSIANEKVMHAFFDYLEPVPRERIPVFIFTSQVLVVVEPGELCQCLGGMYTGFRGGEYALDNHTLFLMGMENRFAISERVLFHKGFESEVEPYSKRMPNSRDIYLSFLAYRDHITGSDLKRREKLALQALAALNFMRTFTRNLMGRALIKLNLLSPVLRYYRTRTYGR